MGKLFAHLVQKFAHSVNSQWLDSSNHTEFLWTITCNLPGGRMAEPLLCSRREPIKWCRILAPLAGANVNLTFWMCFALVGYSYVGYPIWLWLVWRARRIPFTTASFSPKVSIIIAVRNEERNLPKKLENLKELNYPQDRREIIVISDGSIDRTASILRHEASWITPIILDAARGKAAALNKGVKLA